LKEHILKREGVVGETVGFPTGRAGKPWFPAIGFPQLVSRNYL